MNISTHKFLKTKALQNKKIDLFASDMNSFISYSEA